MSIYPDKYCLDIHNYERFPTIDVKIGNSRIGSNYPVRIQSMTNVPATDIESSIIQTKKIFDAGADFVRIATPRILDVECLKTIKKSLHADGYIKPLIADVHFNPRIAEEAAKIVEKVRINPGNYIDKRAVFKQKKYSDSEYKLELENIHENIKPLLAICKEYGTAIRVGSNHGSLSDRILTRFGNTIEGMVEAAMEYLEIMIAENFMNVVVSMKASDTRTMVKACRLLNARMLQTGKIFPQHLGVTEAGEGEDGRLKSAIGIGALLSDGIGGTIRVSLTEAPEKEIPFARLLVDKFENKKFKFQVSAGVENTYNPYINQRNIQPLSFISTNYLVLGDYSVNKKNQPDLIYCEDRCNIYPEKHYLMPYQFFKNLEVKSSNIYPLFNISEFTQAKSKKYNFCFISLTAFELRKTNFFEIAELSKICLILEIATDFPIGEIRYTYNHIKKINKDIPIIIKYESDSISNESILADIGIFPGSALIDGLVSGIWIRTSSKKSNPVNLSFDLLQAAGLRFSKAEFISCPSCGRTEYDIEEVSKEVKNAFAHLIGLKIAVMGCLVNGPGEMADADYGCVGSKKGEVHIYKGKTVIKKNVAEENIVEELSRIIKENEELKK